MNSVWAYIRVSGDEQANRGLPVAGQRRAIEEYARDHNLHLARVFVDEARSGGTDQREQFQLMMHLAHQAPPPCSALLLWSWSRFARDQNDAHYWKASLRRQGIQIHDISGETPDAPTGFEYVLESLIHWKDAQKLIELSRASRRGQQTLAKLGYVPTGGRPPTGFRVEFEEVPIEGRIRRLRHWSPDPETWPLMVRAWRMRLAGHSYKEIWHEVGLFKTSYCFSTFFKNPIYKGELWYGGTLIPVPAAVTPEEWHQVNKGRQARRSGRYARRKGSRYLLSGLLTCARCGAALTGFRHRGGMRGDGYVRRSSESYVCIGRRQRTCDLPRISTRKVDKAVLDLLFDQVLTEENLKQQRQEIAKHLDVKRPALEAKRTKLQGDLRGVNHAIEGILDAIEHAPGSDSLPDRLMGREADRERILAELAQVEGQLALPTLQFSDVAQMRRTLRAAIESGDPRRARELLYRIIAGIDLDADSAKVKYRIPF